MNWMFGALAAAGPMVLCASATAGSMLAGNRPRQQRNELDSWSHNTLRRLVESASWLALLAACGSTALLIATGPLDLSLAPGFTLYFDALTAAMSLLITFVGAIITRFSVRYLDGDPTQARFMRWLALTLAAVLTLVISGNLLMLFLAWIATSLSLHQLLTHYRERPAARLAARKKFLISRLGDLMLLGAIGLIYQACGTLELRDVLAAAQHPSTTGGWGLAGLLLALGAMTKSAQFPLHSWLPDTMESPTPVSALMHAGIINAGGFLVIRLSPVVTASASGMQSLLLVGGITALYGATVMLTQTSVKRALAYSTIAQMGFMIMQCGLGAFSGALLHLIGHSLYKAHAFLNSGCVLEAIARSRSADPKPATPGLLRPFGVLLLAAATTLWTGWLVLGETLASKPGVMALATILTLAVGLLLWHSQKNLRLFSEGLLVAQLICLGYFAGFWCSSQLLVQTASYTSYTPTAASWVLQAVIIGGFVGVFLLQANLPRLSAHPAFRQLYVHASNGFYLDVCFRLLLKRLRLSPAERHEPATC